MTYNPSSSGELHESLIKTDTYSDGQNNFIPSKTFSGSKAGYAFRMGGSGLGYYIDDACSQLFADDKGRHAPPKVRRAAEEVESAFRVLQGIRAVRICYAESDICCLLRYCPRLCPDHISKYKFTNDIEERVLKADEGWNFRDNTDASVVRAAEENIRTAEANLRVAINSSVVNPISYENDMTVVLSWSMWTDGHFRVDETLENVVKRWVNAHGGWKEDGNANLMQNSQQGISQVLMRLDRSFQETLQTKKEILQRVILAANQGNVKAQFYLGDMYRNGRVVEQDEREAARYYSLAADQGDIDAQVALLHMYEEDQEVAEAVLEAVRLYKHAANQEGRIVEELDSLK